MYSILSHIDNTSVWIHPNSAFEAIFLPWKNGEPNGELNHENCVGTDPILFRC